MKFRYLHALSSLAFLGGQNVYAQLASPAPSNSAAPPTVGLEDIVVTASRRSESIGKVPTALSAFNGDKLRGRQITSLSDLTSITPNVQIATYSTNANITIRGIGNGNFLQIGGEPGVAVHQNGVYLGQSSLALSTFLDVERVEILRGPQGTLFGRNATGGAVNIISKTPTKETSYGAEVTAGVDPAIVRSSAYLSGALDSSGKLLGRISAEQNYNVGYSRNFSPDGPSRLDGLNDLAARAQLEWRPIEDFHVRLLAEYAQNKDSGPAAYLSGTPSGPAVFPFVLLPLFGLPPMTPITPPASSIGNPATREAQVNLGNRNMNARTAIISSDLAVGGGHLTAIASYNDTFNHTEQDGDGTSIPFNAVLTTNTAYQKYAELLYSSDPKKAFIFILGGNYFNEHVTQNESVPTLGLAPLIPFLFGGVVQTESFATFAHVQYNLLSNTRVFAGVRYSNDHKRETEYQIFGLTTLGANSRAFDKITYEAGVSSDLSKSLTAYAKYATGYKSGGFSVGSFTTGFQPETDSNVEAGLKGSLLGGVLQANLAAFHINYSNLQVTQVVGLVSAVTNAAAATVNGVEIESVIRPFANLRIEASGAYLNAKFDRFDTADSSRPNLGVLHLAGNTLSNAPRFAGSVGIFYDLDALTGKITPGVRIDYKSRQYFSEFNIPISSQNPNAKGNLYLNYRSDDDRWTGSVFALNVTNKLVRSNVVVVSAVLGSLAVTQYQPGRQIGLSVGYHF